MTLALDAHGLPRPRLVARSRSALTLVFGRVFCGWICPFGTLHHFFGWIFPSPLREGRQARRGQQDARLPARKYYLMYAFLARGASPAARSAACFDPICIAVRAIGLGVIPALQYVGIRGARRGADTQRARRADRAPTARRTCSRSSVWQSNQFYFHQTWFIVFLLVAILFMNRFIPRFWCRVLCPLGAFLGVFARFALFGMEKDHAKCTDCNLCLVHCQGADSPQGGVKWRQDECHMCLNCETACPEDVIKFRFLPEPQERDRRARPRRAAPRSRRPPPARWSSRRCASPTGSTALQREGHPPAGRGRGARVPRALHPLRRVHEGVPEQRASPGVLRGRHRGPVDADPHRAHRLLRALVRALRPGLPDRRDPEDHREAEAGHRRRSRSAIGTAFYDQGRCLPWAMATPCIVCEEFCPTSPKAIWVEEVEVPKRDGKSGPGRRARRRC